MKAETYKNLKKENIRLKKIIYTGIDRSTVVKKELDMMLGAWSSSVFSYYNKGKFKPGLLEYMLVLSAFKNVTHNEMLSYFKDVTKQMCYFRTRKLIKLGYIQKQKTKYANAFYSVLTLTPAGEAAVRSYKEFYEQRVKSMTEMTDVRKGHRENSYPELTKGKKGLFD